ncbi:hypothetical protein SAMD00023353_1700630 [Rosellinia necatrix]|uniref:Uncharacterized protein n=1 Tax=Rosellinia necatrix TaxID=77044 RepID=A0A1S8A795_ROSNE|nr:hypothetical protein SAMD00023353_1700630 [Rosellinia necatrix]
MGSSSTAPEKDDEGPGQARRGRRGGRRAADADALADRAHDRHVVPVSRRPTPFWFFRHYVTCALQTPGTYRGATATATGDAVAGPTRGR